MNPPRPVDPFLPQLDGFEVHRVLGARAGKDYVCPDCYVPIAAGQGHVVAWPLDDVEQRRHWHLHCWRLAVRRGRIA
jgi:hypothetical protein